MKKNLFATLSITSALFLSACGGGGSDSAPTPLPPPSTPIDFPLRTAYVNYLTATGSNTFTVTGDYVEAGQRFPITGSGSTTLGAMTGATFEGVPAQKKTMTILGSVAISGVSDSLNSTQDAYYDSNYNALGMSGVDYKIVTSSKPIPTTARINDTGSLYTGNRYASSTKSQLLGTFSASYAIQEDTTTTAIINIISTEKDTAGKTISTSTAKYRMTTSGSVTNISESGVAHTTNPMATVTLNIIYKN